MVGAVAAAIVLVSPVAHAVWDFGDAPDSYGTNPDSPNGYPVHQTGQPDSPHSAGLSLGEVVNLDCTEGQHWTCPEMESELAGRDDTEEGWPGHVVDDEDGISFTPGLDASGETFTVTAQVFDRFDQKFFICGWIDFDVSGTFGSDERSCVIHDATACVLVDVANLEYECQIEFTVPDSLPTEPTFSRFRIWPADGTCASPDASCAGPTGVAQGPPAVIQSAGEVEDHLVPLEALPVSLNSFASRVLGAVLRVAWTTASETFNIGFNLFARVDGERRLLNDRPVRSKAPDSITPQAYRERFRPESFGTGDIEALAVASLDTTGREEWYGPFEIGESYGEQAAPAVIDWGAVRRDVAQRMTALGLDGMNARFRLPEGARDRLTTITRALGGGGAPRRAGAGSAAAGRGEALLTVAEPGMQQVTFEALAGAGVDLRGVPVEALAVAFKDQPVPRVVRSRDAVFGPSDAILFWGEAPDGADALYIDRRVYRLLVNADQAREAVFFDRRPRNPRGDHLAMVTRDEPVRYEMISATGDPWVQGHIIAFGAASSADYALRIDGDLVDDARGRLELVLAGLTDWPHGGDDHHVRVFVNDEQVADETADGQVRWDIAAPIPPGVLKHGDNTVTVTVTGQTGHPYDGVIVDAIHLGHPAPLRAREGRLVFDDRAEHAADGFRASGFTARRLVAFATADGNLAELAVRAVPRRGRRGFEAHVPAVAAGAARYWVSAEGALFAPRVEARAERNLVADDVDYVIIVHPSFLPVPGDSDHPLSRYLAAKRDEGWRVAVIDTESIYAAHGWNMALPEAITRFLATLDERADYGHVLLVGGDCYDYHDHLGSGCVSFVPTRYARTGQVLYFTPSDALVADLDGDGLSDKAIGRWPVRTVEQLAAVVDKSLAWSDPAAGMRFDASAVWAADSLDPATGSFAAQSERMIGRLRTPLAGDSSAPWPAERIDRVYLDDIVNEVPVGAALATARERLVAAINEGRTITGFAGHGSPVSWTFQNLFTPTVAGALTNAGKPTQVVTLTCYTTYFVSPGTDTLAHQLLAGGRNGAVAVHGAATLSAYGANEAMATQVLDRQLLERRTIGEAILHAGRALAEHAGAPRDVAVNWTLLGDPTLLTGN